MILNLKGKKLTIDSIIESESLINNLEREDVAVVEFIKKWFKNKQEFHFSTSGSTGKPRTIPLQREQLVYSATQTLHHLSISKGGKSLLCISPDFIGGTMVIVRSLVNQMDLDVITASRKIEIPDNHYQLASMVPLQMQWIVEENQSTLNHFKNIIIGGAGLHPRIEDRILQINSSANVYSSYGMTETASHVALRRLGEELYTAMGDVVFDTDIDHCLKMKGTITRGEWLKTHDMVDLKSKTTFTLKGRKDFIINTGGIKVNPEKVENDIAQMIERPFIISSIPDSDLGEKIVLIVEGETTLPDMNHLLENKYERPKEVFFIENLIYTESGKVDRKGTQNHVLSSLKS